MYALFLSWTTSFGYHSIIHDTMVFNKRGDKNFKNIISIKDNINKIRRPRKVSIVNSQTKKKK